MPTKDELLAEHYLRLAGIAAIHCVAPCDDVRASCDATHLTQHISGMPALSNPSKI
jgi:hypothetical protein